MLLQRSLIVTSLGLLASCAVVDSPTAISSGSGIPLGVTISLSDSDESANDQRMRAAITSEIQRSGYRIAQQGEYHLEFGFAKRSAAIGILLAEQDASKPEAGSWRSRPVDRDLITLCDSAIYRLMVVVTHEQSGEIRYRGSSDDDHCGEPDDQKLKALAVVALSDLRLR